MPRELLIMQNSFAWTDAEGVLITADKALSSNARNFKVEGKTYQNLFTKDMEFTNESGNYVGIEELKNLKSNTTYTVEVDLKSVNTFTTNNNNKSNIFRVDQYDINEKGGLAGGISGTITSTYQTFKFTFTTVSNFKRAIVILRNNFTTVGLDSNTMYAKNIKVIEGDHTNTDLPTEINGIESVAERERKSKNLFKDEGWVQKHASGSDSNTRVTNNFRLPVKLNDVYVLNFNAPDNNFQVSIQGYKADGTYYSEGLNTGWLIKSQLPQVVKIKNADVKYIGFTCRYSGDLNISTTDYNVLNSNITLLPNLYTEGNVNVKGKNSWYGVGKNVTVKPYTNYNLFATIESISKGDNNANPQIQIFTTKSDGTADIHIGTFSYNSTSLAKFRTTNITKIQLKLLVNDGTASTTDCEANFKNIAVTEVNLYPVQIAQSHNETDGIVLPNGVKNSIENGVYIRRIGKYKITGNEQYELRYENDAMFTVQCGGLSIETTFDDFGNSDVKMICDKAVCKRCIDTTFITDKLTVCSRSSISKGFVIAIPKKLLTEYTIDKVKEYIKSLGGMTVWYQLATPITEPLTPTEILLPQPLRSLPNGVCDEVVGNKLIQRVGVQRLDGSENWEVNIQLSRENGHIAFKYKPNNFLLEPRWITTISDRFCGTVDNALINNMASEFITGHGWAFGLNISINKEKLSVPNEIGFKEWLSQNPTIVYYELATPIEHTIEQPIISISKGANLISTSNNIQPNLKLTYKKLQEKKPTPKPPKPPTTAYLYNAGNECTELTGGYLTSSNNSATCNIEKQADNLYVNCTGKTNFDSICYARTNNYIKPCKIKVSVKNNYISANGIAFCVFLSEKEAITSVSDFNSVVNKKYIKASNTTPNEYIDLEMDLTDSTEGYFYIACMVAGNTGYTCKANINKIKIIS